MWPQTTHLKDRYKPKGPMSAYSCFVQVVREECKRKYPNDTVKFSDFSKICAERWKIMNDKEKQRFHDMAAADKERYNKEISEYIPPEGYPKGKKRKTPRDPLTPKRALSPFFIFSDEFRAEIRAEHPDWSVAAVAKELGKRWETCENKAKYEALSQKDKERYEEDMKKFRNGTFVPPKKESTGASSSSTTASANTSFSALNQSKVEENGEDNSHLSTLPQPSEDQHQQFLSHDATNQSVDQMPSEPMAGGTGEPSVHVTSIEPVDNSVDNSNANLGVNLDNNQENQQQQSEVLVGNLS